MAIQAAAAAGNAGKAAAIQAAASAAAPAIGSVFGLIGAKKRMRLQNEYNMQLAKYQNDLNLAQWERENEYNLPINQMARLKEAGINPRMAYGDSASSSAANSPNLVVGEQQAAPNLAQTMQTAFGQFQNVFNQMNQIQALQAEIRNKNAQTEMYQSLTNVNEINARLRSLEEILKTRQNYYYDMDKFQSFRFKQWALVNMIASYYDKYGPRSVFEDTGNDIPLPEVNSSFFGGETRYSLDRRIIASQIGLNNAKALESAWNAKNKEQGINFMKRRMRSMDLLDEATRLANRLTYHKGNTEMERQNNMLMQRSLWSAQKALMEESLLNMQEHRLDFVPFIGNVSDYTSGLFGNYTNSLRFTPKYR